MPQKANFIMLKIILQKIMKTEVDPIFKTYLEE